jgi:hypothetical protein
MQHGNAVYHIESIIRKRQMSARRLRYRHTPLSRDLEHGSRRIKSSDLPLLLSQPGGQQAGSRADIQYTRRRTSPTFLQEAGTLAQIMLNDVQREAVLVTCGDGFKLRIPLWHTLS